MVVVSPLTADVCITHHETFSFKCYSIIMCHQFVKLATSSNVLGRLVLHEQKRVGQGEVGWYTQSYQLHSWVWTWL